MTGRTAVASEPRPVNKRLLILAVLGLLLFGGGGAGALFALGIVGGSDGGDDEAKVEAEAEAEAQAKVEAKVEPEPEPEAEPEAEPVPAATYIELKPLAAPVIQGNRVLFNVLLTLSIELSDQTEKEAVARFMPRLRDAMLRELHQNPIKRLDDNSRFDLAEVKGRMLKIVRDTTRNKAVRDVLVIAAFRIN